jgi:hypothetical protein
MIVVLGRWREQASAPLTFIIFCAMVVRGVFMLLGIKYTRGTAMAGGRCCAKKQFAPRDVEHNAHYIKSRSASFARARAEHFIALQIAEAPASNNLCCSKSSLGGESKRTSSCALWVICSVFAHAVDAMHCKKNSTAN